MQTTDAQIQSVSQVRPAAVSKTRAASRLTYIDAIRTVLVILVIMVHAAVTYGSIGDWTYEDPIQEDQLTVVLLSLFVILSQSFFMGLFFFYSGVFSPGSYDRKGIAVFWKDRLLRLAFPMIAYTLFLSRIPNYINAVANHGVTLSFWQFARQTFWTQADAGPTWFLFFLLVFTAGYTLWRLATRWIPQGWLSWASRLPAAGTRSLLGLALVLSAIMFVTCQEFPIAQNFPLFGVIAMQVAFFPSYIILFIGGILAYRNHWLERLPGKSLRFWGWLSAALVIALPALLILGGATKGMLALFFTGLTWRCILTSLWFGLACVSFSVTLTLWLRDRIHSGNRLATFAGPNNFAVYLIHPLVLVPITFGLSLLPIHPLIKFSLASLSTVVACYLLADGLRRIPGAKSIL